jgi:quercetin dioxygenase-like cupin family protein
MNQEALKEYYGTLSETINELNKLGYTLDFNIQEECLVCHHENIQLPPEEFQIDKVFRFEGMSDPEDQSILYAISSDKHQIKGVLVNGYGISSDEFSSQLIDRIKVHPTENEEIHLEATPLRPEGDRALFAPLIEMDLQSSIVQIKSESSWAEKDHNSIALFKSDTMRIVLMGFHKNAELKPHIAKGIISFQVISGEIVFKTAEKNVNLKTDQMIALDEGITHSVLALEESFVLLTLAMK